MSAISRAPTPRPDDPRVVRSRAAVVEAARTLFLKHGYAGTTMEEIAESAGLTKRTLYNNYADKEALFTGIVQDALKFAESFAVALRDDFTGRISASNAPVALHEIGRRLVLAIVRPEVIALRRLLIGESRAFPALARQYFDRAPGQVIDTLAAGFEHLSATRVLRIPDPHRAAEQFAYLVAGAPLDRAVLIGKTPPAGVLIACAHDGVETFLARYRPGSSRRGKAGAP